MVSEVSVHRGNENVSRVPHITTGRRQRMPGLSGSFFFPFYSIHALPTPPDYGIVLTIFKVALAHLVNPLRS
jgi:hypothetical protein